MTKSVASSFVKSSERSNPLSAPAAARKFEQNRWKFALLGNHVLPLEHAGAVLVQDQMAHHRVGVVALADAGRRVERERNQRRLVVQVDVEAAPARALRSEIPSGMLSSM